MKIFAKSLLLLILRINSLSFAESKKYLNEFKLFKKSDAHQVLFDYEDTWHSISDLQRDLHNCKQLSFLQRFVRFMFFDMDTVIVTPQTMPQLFEYVDTLCKTNNMATPIIFIPAQKGFFNAAAAKFLCCNSGGIVIGQKMLKEANDEELESVLAHEIGHIKHNHVNKFLGLNLFIAIALNKFLDFQFNLELQNISAGQKTAISVLKKFYSFFYAPLITKLIIGKHFEKQADEFAYKTMHKGTGLKSFFETIIKKHNEQSQSFDKIKLQLKEARPDLSLLDYGILNLRYFVAKFGFTIHKINRWIYHNTRLGAHPSPEARIETIEKYLSTIDAH